MSDKADKRRLSAVMFADIADYTRLIEADTEATVLAWKNALSGVIEPTIDDLSGRIVKYTGDGFLAEFDTVENAVDCAMRIQTSLASCELGFRIGVGLGDVVDDGRDIHGEGVNIAARIEALSEPGLVAISGEARRLLKGVLRKDFQSNGSFDLKHVSEPVEVWSWPHAFTAKKNRRSTNELPRLFISDFESTVDDARSMAKAIVTDLNNSFGKQTGLTLVFDKGKSDFTLEGQVRVSGNRWRVVARLLDITSGACVWSNQYEEIGDDEFDVQDNVVFRISGAVRMAIPGLIAEELKDRPLDDMSVQELLNHAMGCHYKPNLASWERGNIAIRKAIDLDQTNWTAMSMLCFNILSQRRLFDWRGLSTEEVKEAGDWIARALELNPANQLVRTVSGAYCLFGLGDVVSARIELDEALQLNPSYYHALNLISLVELYEGYTSRAKEYANEALKCDPTYPYRHLYRRDAGLIALYQEEYEEALHHLVRADRSAPGLPLNQVGLVAANALLERREEAGKSYDQLCQAYPEFDPDRLIEMPFANREKRGLIARVLQSVSFSER